MKTLRWRMGIVTKTSRWWLERHAARDDEDVEMEDA